AFSHPTYSRTGRSATLLCSWLPMILTKEAVMHIGGSIEVSMALVVASGAEKELAPFNCHGDQFRITFAFHDLLGGDRLALQEMNGRRFLAQDQLGAFCFPSTFRSPLVKIAVVYRRIVDPQPL